jgi:hypothetical protein
MIKLSPPGSTVPKVFLVLLPAQALCLRVPSAEVYSLYSVAAPTLSAIFAPRVPRG